MKYYKLSILFISIILVSCSSDDNSNNSDTEASEEESQTIDKSLNKKNVGDSANDLLSAQKFQSLMIDIFYVEGFKPTTNTISNFETFLSERLNKPGGIETELKMIASPGQDVYTITEIRDIEDQIRTKYNNGSELTVFGLFLDGEYSENTENGSVLGVAYRNTSFIIFEETVQQFSGQPFAPTATVLESTVLNHEFGHIMGMVNAGTPMQNEHQDEAHGRHCTSEDCLMYWTAETGEGLVNMISGGTIPSFDSFCLADLKANGGK
ncbi:membrane metalloprotease [Aurantibacter crassamenti]|uniref:membrane metalloprotease n=1 Tax=Aurantibacter crassamenti TaxID=1837375 RepID=UPI0019398080|nr:membrane metalloprotease [Aurantibacter crassamenti]MBM1106871.1 membrane metalloprotease [Aurantibacter crassamenti]